MSKTKTKLLMKTIAMVVVCVMISHLFPAIVLGIQEEIELQNENTILLENTLNEETTKENTITNETQVEEETKEPNEETQEPNKNEEETQEENSTEEENNQIEEKIETPEYIPEIESKIIGEIEEKRTLNEKHFLLNDGTMYATKYPSNVHYEENGKLLDIDNSFQETQEEGGTLENKNNSFKVKFSKKSNKNNLVKLQINNQNIKWSLQNSNKVEAKAINTNKEQKGKINLNKITSGTIKYENILENIDVEYNVVSEQIKENIILKNKEAINQEIVFEYDTNLKMEKIEDGKIAIYEKNKENILLLLETPYMYDELGEMSADLEMELTNKNNKHTITIKPNKEWLESEERQYPVTIDPVVQTYQSYSTIQDTYIFDGDGGYPTRHVAQIVRVGNGNKISSKQPIRGLLKFDLPTLSSGDQVIQSRLDICAYPDTNEWNPPTETVQIDAHKITQDWTSQSAYWNNLNDKYDSKIEDYIKYNYNQNSGWYYFDITSIVKDWYSTGNNYGVMLKEHQEVYNLARSDVYFCSSDMSGTYASMKPMVEIQYRNQTGLESYQTYHIQSIGRAGTTYTNDYNGNVVLIHQDASTPGSLMPVSVNHVYNTNDKGIDIGYGQGFRLNLSQTITLETIGGIEYAKYIDEDGTTHYLKKEGAIYKDEDGLNLTLEMQGNGSFLMKDKEHNTLLFEKRDSTWHLKEATDTYGNKIVIDFDYTDGKFLIKKVTDAAGDSITFTYDNSRLLTITDPQGRVTRMQYTGNYILQKILYFYGETNPDESRYVFYGDNRLAEVHNIDNSYITYEYYDKQPYRIKAVREYGTGRELGGTLNITYGDNVTTFEDNEKHKNTYSFNNYGQTISIANFGRLDNKDKAYGTMYKYGEESNNRNKLTLEGEAFCINEKSSDNLLQNGDFSQGFTGWEISNCDGNDKVEDGVYKFVGDANWDKNIHQRINQAGKKGDIYNLAAWVNSRAVQHNVDKNIKISISIHFERYDNSLQVIDKNVNVDGRGWQFQDSVVIADSDYRAITVYLVCTNNANETYFDNIGLFKEEFGQSYTYDSNGNVISTEDNSKNKQQFTYDSNNNLISAINPKNGKFEYQYDTSNPKKLISATNSIGNKYWFSYDSKGNMTNATVGETGNIVPNVGIQYQAHVQDIGWQDWVQNGETAGKLYESKRMEAINIKLAPNATNAHIKYRAHVQDVGWQNWLQDGETAGTLYEGKRIEAIEIKLENLPGYNVKYRVHVQDIGWQSWVQNGQTAGTMYVGRRIEAIEIKLEKTSSNKYYEASAQYSANGNYQTELTDDSGSTTKYQYNGATGTVSKVTDAKNNETNYTYDGLDRTTKVEKQAGGKTYKNEYTYNKDKLQTITHNNFTYNFVYDCFGNVKQTKVGNQILATNTYADNNGDLTKVEYGNGQTIFYSYDPYGRQKSFIGSGGSYNFSYDAKSNLKTIKDTPNKLVITNTYDLANRLVNQHSKYNDLNKTFTKEYEYDINNNISKTKYILEEKTKTVNYNYDELNRINNITEGTTTWSNTKDNLSRKTEQKITTGSKNYATAYTYIDKENGKTTPRISTLQNGTNEKLTYTYDALGNIETIKKGNTVTNQYYYDELNQLIREIDILNNKMITYEYDAGGNIQNKKEYGYYNGTASSTPSKTINYTYGNTNWKDQLTAYNGKAITYDEIGNPLSYDGNTYTWQKGRQLIGISNNTNTITYKYSHEGIRTQKTVNGTTSIYYLEGSKVIYEQTGENTTYYTYDENGQIIGINYNNTQYYYIKNAQNDIVGILDSNLNQIVSYEYDSWGKVISIKDANGNNITSNTHIGKINPYRYIDIEAIDMTKKQDYTT